MFGIFADVMKNATLRPGVDIGAKTGSKQANEHHLRIEMEEQKLRRQFYQQKW